MEVILKDGTQYIQYKQGKAKIIFFTAFNELDFNMAGEGFSSAIEKVRNLFKLKEIGYSRQIHSDVVHIFDGSVRNGDGLITDRAKTSVGVFTADCVPVIIYDSDRNICAAVHSGWKGTYSRITIKAIEKMQVEYGSDIRDMSVFIGPHIKECCYEVGQDLVEKFEEDPLYRGVTIAENRKLSLEKCILTQCISAGINKENIYSTNLCTFCSEEKDGVKLHSYRRFQENSGRMLSLVYIDN